MKLLLSSCNVPKPVRDISCKMILNTPASSCCSLLLFSLKSANPKYPAYNNESSLENKYEMNKNSKIM